MKPPWRNIGYEMYMADLLMRNNPGCSVYVGWFDNELVINVPTKRKFEDAKKRIQLDSSETKGSMGKSNS